MYVLYVYIIVYVLYMHYLLHICVYIHVHVALHTTYMCVYTCTCIVKLTLEQQTFEMHGPTYTRIVFNKYVLQYHTIVVG